MPPVAVPRGVDDKDPSRKGKKNNRASKDTLHQSGICGRATVVPVGLHGKSAGNRCLVGPLLAFWQAGARIFRPPALYIHSVACSLAVTDLGGPGTGAHARPETLPRQLARARERSG